MRRHRAGTRCECDLPDYYDARTRIAEYNGMLIIAHPEFAPRVYRNGKLEPVEDYMGLPPILPVDEPSPVGALVGLVVSVVNVGALPIRDAVHMKLTANAAGRILRQLGDCGYQVTRRRQSPAGSPDWIASTPEP